MSTTQKERVLPAYPEGAETSSIHIDTASVPDYARDNLAAATLGFLFDILRQPGGREALDARTAARKAAAAVR